ncbi:MAG TPA: nicotinate-nucleotide adenylyltransferase [Verrucomicrobiae bacterium]|jgi:nicotinate-nucleotide adenylyltransferase|nr:nicotinate-nucleotide adenylyltransferase [Verrucomicrobiae bacterium]
MKIAIFGGTFDPVHVGHLAVARAAADKFDLGRIYFVPAETPPHKLGKEVAAFQHRFAMLALATADDPRFVPSLLEAHSAEPNYSIQTVRRLKNTLRKSDKLYFLIGIDAFKEISAWRRPVELLSQCDFIVASRPGHSLAEVGEALPEALRPSAEALQKLRRQRAGSTIVLPSTTIHLLNDVSQRVSSTQIRAAARKPVKYLGRYVPRLVAGYIKKERLYMGDDKASGGPEQQSLLQAKVLSFRGARVQER